MNLHPTPARRALLDQVAAGNVFRTQQFLRGGHVREWDSNDATGRRVTAAMVELVAAGWVTLPAFAPVDRTRRRWQPTRLGRAVNAVRLMDYGTHAVAETGPVDEPTYLGQVTGDLNRPSRWVAEVGPNAETGLRRPEAVAALHRMAVQVLVDLEHDAREGASS
ncbi:hypothetical protein [Micromonospora aurantiaca (nom. illeg.)]|uniref:hypothetical protein n=1 Tax=Micromonospora aurantiaca (nom. illeg.) TaxID=47850 RepID=UPI0033D28CA5